MQTRLQVAKKVYKYRRHVGKIETEINHNVFAIVAIKYNPQKYRSPQIIYVSCFIH